VGGKAGGREEGREEREKEVVEGDGGMGGREGVLSLEEALVHLCDMRPLPLLLIQLCKLLRPLSINLKDLETVIRSAFRLLLHQNLLFPFLDLFSDITFEKFDGFVDVALVDEDLGEEENLLRRRGLTLFQVLLEHPMKKKRYEKEKEKEEELEQKEEEKEEEQRSRRRSRRRRRWWWWRRRIYLIARVEAMAVLAGSVMRLAKRHCETTPHWR